MTNALNTPIHEAFREAGMLIATVEQQKLAIFAIIQQLAAEGVDVQAVAEGAKLRIFGSPDLFELPAEYRLRSASAVDELISEALATPANSAE
jgi:hypothetical protein